MREGIGRRRFVAAAALGAVGAAAGTASGAARADAPEVTWRLTSSFPKSLDLLYGGAEIFARQVGAITGGRFRIDVFPPGDIVPGLGALDAVGAGTVEACQTALDYYYGKDPAFALPTAFPFGMNAREQTRLRAAGRRASTPPTRSWPTTGRSPIRRATRARRWAASSAARSSRPPTSRA